MGSSKTGRCRQILILSLSAALVAGCAAPRPPNATPASLPQVNLSALSQPVSLDHKHSDQHISLNKDQSADVAVGDTFKVAEGGRGFMQIDDRLFVDLLTGAEGELTNLQLEASDALLVELTQLLGHVRYRLGPTANLRLKLDTSIGLITTSKANTEFIVCHNPTSVTCVAVRSGEIELTAKDKIVTVRAGESAFVLKDSDPSRPICLPAEQLDSWWDNRLSSSPDAISLSELVQKFEAQGCSGNLAADATRMPTSEGVAATPATSPIAATPPPTGAYSPTAVGMVQVNDGTYVIGIDAGDDFHILKMQRSIGAFWIDATEVTNEQYQAFIDATGHAPPAVWPGRPKHPVKGLSFQAASDFCAWAGKRLPTELEWEVAARGPGESPPAYPWGNDPSAGGEAFNLPLADTYEAGSIAFNRSPFGAFDLAGNVWEWVGEPYAALPDGKHVLRGGRHGLIRDMAFRQPVAPDGEKFLQYAGARCAATSVKEEK